MTPRERAQALIGWGRAPVELAERLIAEAVAEERAAIARWLRPRAARGLLPSSYCDQIANGEHA